jgi:hypothetical protein
MVMDINKIVEEYKVVESKVIERKEKRKVSGNDWNSGEVRRDVRDVMVMLKEKKVIEECVLDMSVVLGLLRKGNEKYEKLDMSRLRSCVIYGGMFELEGDRESGKKLRLKRV